MGVHGPESSLERLAEPRPHVWRGHWPSDRVFREVLGPSGIRVRTTPEAVTMWCGQPAQATVETI